jgi:hypothetical protein
MSSIPSSGSQPLLYRPTQQRRRERDEYLISSESFVLTFYRNPLPIQLRGRDKSRPGPDLSEEKDKNGEMSRLLSRDTSQETDDDTEGMLLIKGMFYDATSIRDRWTKMNTDENRAGAMSVKTRLALLNTG